MEKKKRAQGLNKEKKYVDSNFGIIELSLDRDSQWEIKSAGITVIQWRRMRDSAQPEPTPGANQLSVVCRDAVCLDMHSSYNMHRVNNERIYAVTRFSKPMHFKDTVLPNLLYEHLQQNMWFVHDGAQCCCWWTLKREFPKAMGWQGWISPWPAWLPDLNPLYFLPLGYFKTLVSLPQ